MKKSKTFWAIYNRVKKKYQYFTNKQICITTTYIISGDSRKKVKVNGRVQMD